MKKVAIAGAGGIGAYFCQFLADYAVSRQQIKASKYRFDLYDPDVVDIGNLLHQNFDEGDLGRLKAEVVAERSFGLFKPKTEFLTKEQFSDYDIVISCVDSMPFRVALYNYGFDNPDYFWIDGRCNSRHFGVFHSKLPQERLKSLLSEDTKRTGCLRDVDKQNRTAHATPLIVAGLLLQYFLNYDRDDLTSSDILLYV